MKAPRSKILKHILLNILVNLMYLIIHQLAKLWTWIILKAQ